VSRVARTSGDRKARPTAGTRDGAVVLRAASEDDHTETQGGVRHREPYQAETAARAPPLRPSPRGSGELDGGHR